ncbi:MAG TPA: hypothetical protein VN181_13165, partial [Thermoanaerobaculia bacterium]|nr:hypothetical protein [Thermoanaerobaculia bacterium]
SFLIVRYGLLAEVVCETTFFLFLEIPFAPGASWVTPVTIIPFAVMIAAAVWAFTTSLGGKSPFNTALVDG